MLLIPSAVLFLLASTVLGRIYFEESFDDDSWKNRWITSTHNEQEFGKFERTPGIVYNDYTDMGLGTMENDKNYSLITRFPPIDTVNKPLVMQFSAKYNNNLSCGDGRLRLYDCSFEPSSTHEETPFVVMFGSWDCKHVGVKVDNLGGQQRLESKIDWEYDQHTHVYTLIVELNMTYQVLIDDKKMTSATNIIEVPDDNERIASRNGTDGLPPICGIGLVFYQRTSSTIFDNILLSDDVHVAKWRRQELLDETRKEKRFQQAEREQAPLNVLRAPWLIDIVPEDLARILNCNKNMTFQENNDTNNFLIEFNKFLIPFNRTGNNSIIKATAEYNIHHCASNPTIHLWVSFQPQKQDILDDLELVLEIVNEANSIVANTVTKIVINYGFLELDKNALLFVNHEVRRVERKLKSLTWPAPKLALEISDTNCLSTQSIRNLEMNLLDKILMVPMTSGKSFDKMSSHWDIRNALIHCIESVELANAQQLSVLHTHVSIELDFESGNYKYQREFVYRHFAKSSNQSTFIIHAANKKSVKDTAEMRQAHLAKDLAKWLYQSSGFSKSHFGAAISWEEDQLLGVDNFASTIFQNFHHILVHGIGRDSKNDNQDHLKTVLHEIASYSQDQKSKAEQSLRHSEDNNLLKTSILLTIDTIDFDVNKRQVDRAIAAARQANEVTAGTVNAIFFDSLACARSATCSGYKKNVSGDICLKQERHDGISNILEYGWEAVNKMEENNTAVTMGTVIDRQFLLNLMEWKRRDCRVVQQSNSSAGALVCKTVLRYQDIKKYGGLQAFKLAIADLSLCNVITKRVQVLVYFYVNVVGCVEDAQSNLTLLVEYARLMENLNGWAEKEDVFLFTNAGAEVHSTCHENAGIGEEVGCNCGWYVKQETHDKYQDKKTAARQLYEKANADQEKTKWAVPTGSLLPLWILAPVIAFGLFTIIPAVILILHYRSKYILTRREVEEFVRGRQVTRADPAAEGDEAAQTQFYNRERFELPPSTFTIDISSGSLGSGEYGQVYRGSIRRDGVEMATAVKMAHPRLIGKSHGYYLALKGMLSEIKVLAYVGEHNHIVALYGAYTKRVRKGEIAVFLELCQLGSLDKYLRSMKPQMVDDYEESHSGTSDPYARYADEENPRGNIQVLEKESSDELYRWAVEIADGMEFLASKKLVHADLATRNVLLTGEKVVKICDFGLSRRLYEYTEYVKKKKNQGALPWRWMAPESLCRSIYNEKTDIWAFGVTLWEIFTLGDQPYPGLTWTTNFPALLDRGLRLPEPRFNVKEIYMVMMSCWEINPALRPTFSQLGSELDPV